MCIRDRYNIQVREFSEVSDDLLDENLKNLCEQFPNCGERFLNEMLRQEKGIVIQRSRVRESLYRIDADDVLKGEERMGYTEEFIMLMAQIIFGIWIHHKLIRWYFVVIGTIDGFSRLPAVLDCTTNNKALTVLDSFVKGVEEYGLPLRVRSDN